MSADDKKVPDIRFKGFSGVWEKRAFGDCFNNIPNNTLSRAELNYEHGIARNIHYGDVLIKFGEILDANDISLPFITDKNFVYKQKHATLRNGDIVIADAAEDSTVGKCTELFNVDKQIILSGLHTIAIRPTVPFASKYLGYYLNSSSYHDQLLPLMQGTKVLSISKSALQYTNINFPSKNEEQIKIGNIFQRLDNLINQHQQKHDKLSNIKKAMLEKMFPKQGETVPEIRFKGFSGEWKEKIIYELFTVTRGNVLPTTKTSPLPTADKCYPVYSSQTKNNGLMGFYDEYLFKDAITWTTDGANAGTVNFREGKFYSTNVNGVLLSDKGYANKAIAEILNKEAWRHVSHVGNPKLMNNVMSAIKIVIPNLIEEQTAIGNYFQKLDELINQHQQQITKLNHIKQACLSKMFI